MSKLKITNDEDVDTRLRRMETRLTKLMEFLGFDIQSIKPTWRNGRVNVASPGTPLIEIINAVPHDWDWEEDVEIYHRGKFLATLNKSEFIDTDNELENDNVA